MPYFFILVLSQALVNIILEVNIVKIENPRRFWSSLSSEKCLCLLLENLAEKGVLRPMDIFFKNTADNSFKGIFKYLKNIFETYTYFTFDQL